MRARLALRVLALLFGLLALPISLVHATHGPTVAQAAEAMVADGSMECFPGGGIVDCTPTSVTYQWRHGRITPESGPLGAVHQQIPAYIKVGYYMDSLDTDWVTRVQSVGCADSTGVAVFMRDMAAALAGGPGIYGPRIVGECSLVGSLSHDTRACPSTGCYYSVTGTILAGAFPPPTPPPPTPSPPVVTPTPIPSPTPTASPSPTASPTPSPTARASGSPTPRPSATPEQTVAGITFAPAPSVVPLEAAPEEEIGWASSVHDPANVSTEPIALASSALLAFVLLLFMGFVGELFNNTAKANYDVLAGWWSTSWLGRRLRRFTDFWKAP